MIPLSVGLSTVEDWIENQDAVLLCNNNSKDVANDFIDIVKRASELDAAVKLDISQTAMRLFGGDADDFVAAFLTFLTSQQKSAQPAPKARTFNDEDDELDDQIDYEDDEDEEDDHVVAPEAPVVEEPQTGSNESARDDVGHEQDGVEHGQDDMEHEEDDDDKEEHFRRRASGNKHNKPTERPSGLKRGRNDQQQDHRQNRKQPRARSRDRGRSNMPDRGRDRGGFPGPGNNGFGMRPPPRGYGRDAHRPRGPGPEHAHRYPMNNGRQPPPRGYGNPRGPSNPWIPNQGYPADPYAQSPNWGAPNQGYPGAAKHGYSDQQPGYSDQKPGYSDQKPGYSNQKPGYSNQKPGYSNPLDAGGPPRAAPQRPHHNAPPRGFQRPSLNQKSPQPRQSATSVPSPAKSPVKGWNSFRRDVIDPVAKAASPVPAAKAAPAKQVSNASNVLRLSNLPSEHCTIAKLASYFSSYGEVVNLSLQPGVQQAQVTFKTAAQAKLAVEDTKPAFGNPQIIKSFAASKPTKKSFAASRSANAVRVGQHKWMRPGTEELAPPPKVALALKRADLQVKVAVKGLAVARSKATQLSKEVDVQKKRLNNLGQGKQVVSSDEKMDVMAKITSLVLQINSAQTAIQDAKKEVDDAKAAQQVLLQEEALRKKKVKAEAAAKCAVAKDQAAAAEVAPKPAGVDSHSASEGSKPASIVPTSSAPVDAST